MPRCYGHGEKNFRKLYQSVSIAEKCTTEDTKELVLFKWNLDDIVGTAKDDPL